MVSDKPRLRPLDFQPVFYREQQMWYLRDPLLLTENQLIFPPGMAHLLLYCDGTRDVSQIHAAFCAHVGQDVDLDVVVDALQQLDEAGLLENERSQQLKQVQLAEYHAAPNRSAALAGLSYPADPAELRTTLDGYGRGDDLSDWQPWQGRAIISPHIDYPRGGPVYSRVWHRAAAAVREAELVLIFGTDHNGSNGSVTLTRQPYATPFGLLPAAPDVVEHLAAALGPDAFAEELHHRREHSVELSAVWLHHIRGDNPCPMVPILTGSFHKFVMNGTHPNDDPHLNAALTALREATIGRRVLVVASVDLAHVGPNFGDDFVMDEDRRTRLMAVDANLLGTINRGDAEGFYQEIAAVQDRNRICGFSSIYLMLRYLESTRGRVVAYDQCAADAENNSLVSICGLLLD